MASRRFAATGLALALALSTLAPSAAPDAPAAAEVRVPTATPELKDAIAKLASDVAGWGGSVAVMAIDVGTGAPIIALNEHAAMNPASNAKLPTAAAALALLGAEHRFVTGLYGKIEREAVDELVLRGDGDPSLTTRDLWSLAHDLRAAGVRRVRAIAVDQSHFDDNYAPPAFEQQPNEWAPFRAPIAPVSLNGNTVLFVVRPTKSGSEAIVSVDPPGFVDVKGTVSTTEKRDPEKVLLSLEPKGARLVAKISGNVPDTDRPVKLSRRVDDPRLLAGYALRSVLKEAGIEAGATVRRGGEKQKRLLVAHSSARLAEILFALGKDSDNFYAEMVFKALSAGRGTSPATSSDAADAVTRQLQAMGAFETGVVVKNGSGLFDANRLTAKATTALLRHMAKSTDAHEFIAQLAVGGSDGTLRSRFHSWGKLRAIRAKTGTLDAVVSLSGYVLAPKGRPPVAFSILVNGVSGKTSAAKPSIDRVVDALAAEVWRGER